MGEAKRRKEAISKGGSKEPRLLPWLPITESQLIKFFNTANRGAWIGIGIVLVAWVTLRFIGPLLGLWTLPS